MASNAEMLRLVQHAAEKLDATRTALVARQCDLAERTAIAAVAYGAGVLRMVASCMMDDPTPPDPLTPLLNTLTDGTSYREWAEQSRHGLTMTDAELDAVARFLEERDGHGEVGGD